MSKKGYHLRVIKTLKKWFEMDHNQMVYVKGSFPYLLCFLFSKPANDLVAHKEKGPPQRKGS